MRRAFLDLKRRHITRNKSIMTKMKIKILAGVLVAGALMSASPATAADEGNAAAAQRGAQFKQRILEMFKGLDITDDQKQKLQPILTEQVQKMIEAFQDQNTPLQDKMQKLKDIQQEFEPRFKEVLTPDQWEKLARRAQEMKSRPGGAGLGGQSGQGGPNRGQLDPAKMQEFMLARTRERLEVTDDAEWNALEPLLRKVMDLQRQELAERLRGIFSGPGGGNAGDANRRNPVGDPPTPEAEALQRVIEARGSNTEMKAATAKYLEARKARQAKLEAAQAELRSVLTVRQEAIATASGLL